MAHRAAGRRSSDGIDGAILETGVGSTGTVLEADTREAGRSKQEVGNAASRAGSVQSRTAGTQERFPRCRAASMANGNAQEVPVEARPGAVAQPIGVTSGRGPY